MGCVGWGLGEVGWGWVGWIGMGLGGVVWGVVG